MVESGPWFLRICESLHPGVLFCLGYPATSFERIRAMSKETIWTLRPDEDLEKYVGNMLSSTDLNRTSFIFACIKLGGPILAGDPELAKSLKVPRNGCQ